MLMTCARRCLQNVGPRGVMPRGKPAAVRFYFDADILGLAKVLVQV
jgi:hypothetical protein